VTAVAPVCRAGNGYARVDFAVDDDAQTVTCPHGWTAASWSACTQRGNDAIVVQFATTDCGPCPAKALCTTGKHRTLTLPPGDLAEAQAAARTAEKTIPFQADYARHARYRGYPKPASTTPTWPSPSTSYTYTPTGTAPHETGDEPAT
jgi:hypothetical protein